MMKFTVSVRDLNRDERYDLDFYNEKDALLWYNEYKDNGAYGCALFDCNGKIIKERRFIK